MGVVSTWSKVALRYRRTEYNVEGENRPEDSEKLLYTASRKYPQTDGSFSVALEEMNRQGKDPCVGSACEA